MRSHGRQEFGRRSRPVQVAMGDGDRGEGVNGLPVQPRPLFGSQCFGAIGDRDAIREQRCETRPEQAL